MTERENALKVYRHELPEWIPILFDAVQHVGFWAGNENGLRGEKISDTESFDCFGVPWTSAHGSPMPVPGVIFLEDIETWKEKVKIPDVSKWDWDFIAEQETMRYDSNKVIVYFSEQGLFDRLITLMGFENALMALMTNPEDCRELFKAIADYKIELIKYTAKYLKPDVFTHTEDIAKVDGLFFSPDIYRDLIKPEQARIIKSIKDCGMIPEQHTCGKFDAVIDDYAEIGVESLFPAQPYNDFAGMKRKYGNTITICGGFDTQGECSLAGASEEIIRKEARRMIDSYGPGGGFIAAPLILSAEDGGTSGGFLTPAQIIYVDEFKKYSKDFYQKPENQFFR